MKHLKTYESIRKGPIQLDIEDIFRELEDDGFNIDVNFFSQGQSLSIYMSRSKPFIVRDTMNDIERCMDYLKEKGWELDRFRVGNEFKSWIDISVTGIPVNRRCQKFSMIFSHNKDVKKYEGFLNFFRKKDKTTIPDETISYDNVIELTKDSFIELVDKGYTVENKYMEFPYVQITKDGIRVSMTNRGRVRNSIELPYKFIDVKDEVLSFCDRVMELGVKIEIAYVYENDKGGYSSEKPTYEDLNNGLYDDREVSILTIYLLGIKDAWKKH